MVWVTGSSVYVIHTEHEARAVGGVDTGIVVVPDRFYAMSSGQRYLNVVAVVRGLRELADKWAADTQEILHHADFVLTTDPAVVESRGSLHDCDTCRAGVARALRLLRENPEGELIVGNLYWVDPTDRGRQEGELDDRPSADAAETTGVHEP